MEKILGEKVRENHHKKEMCIAEVAPFSGIAQTYDYLLTADINASVGSRVWIELGHRQLPGIIVSIRNNYSANSEIPLPAARPSIPKDIPKKKVFSLKPVLHCFDQSPIITEDVRQILHWAAEYYFSSLSDLYRAALPGDLQLRNRVRIYRDEAIHLHTSNEKHLEIIRDLAKRKKPVLFATLTKYFDRKDIYRAISESLIGVTDLSMIAPVPRKLEKNLDESSDKTTSNDTSRKKHTLNTQQKAAVSSLVSVSRTNKYAGFLLHGVTGSGKTEVYLELIEDVIARGKTALVLVPEISLTPQLAGRFKNRFGNQVIILHSALKPKDRLENWLRIQRSEVSVVVGPRSIIFSPLQNIGAIIVDEEHDGSYKQSDGIRYNGRDLALLRSSINNAVCLLGSATPSFEAIQLTTEKKLRRISLPERATANPLPKVNIIDLKRYHPDKASLLSEPLFSALKQNLSRNQQSILLLNRRGFSNFCLCKECGHTPGCENCSVSMTFHLGTRELVCHYCDERKSLEQGHKDADDPNCCGEISLLGFGTQRLEAELSKRLPNARIGRVDRDTVSKRGFLEQCLNDVRNGKLDILVGTQMLAKGHDFPNVTLVGVVLADLGLKFPDFRAAERTFQLVTQVSGRAGRGEFPGIVFVQTYQPDHAAIRYAALGNYTEFIRGELPLREECRYPPYGKLCLIQIDGEKEDLVRSAATKLAKIARRQCDLGQTILGPSAAPLQKLRGRVRYQILVKAHDRAGMHAVLEQLHAARLQGKYFPGVRIHIDRDPYHLL